MGDSSGGANWEVGICRLRADERGIGAAEGEKCGDVETTVSHEAPGYLGHQRKDNVRKISREQMRCILFVCSPRAESRGEINVAVVGCTEAMKVGSRLYLWSADLSSLLLFLFFFLQERTKCYLLPPFCT